MAFGRSKTRGTKLDLLLSGIRECYCLQRNNREFFRKMEMFCILIIVVVMCLYIFVNTHQTVPLKGVDFTVYNLYFNKLDLKIKAVPA